MICHRSEKHNENASRSLLPDCGSAKYFSFGIVAATELVAGGEGLQDLQRKDQKLAEVIEFLETGILPEDKKRAKQFGIDQISVHPAR